MFENPKLKVKEFKDGNSKQQFEVLNTTAIKSVTVFNNGIYIAVSTYIEVIVFDTLTQNPVKNIRRVATPRTVHSVANTNSIAIHFSDNYLILYDALSLDPVCQIVGLPQNHKGIHIQGGHLLVGNSQQLQLWNLFNCQLSLISTQISYINCYTLSEDNRRTFVGNFNGELQTLTKVKVKGTLCWHMGPKIKTHRGCVMAIQEFQGCIFSIDYYLSIVITSENSHLMEFEDHELLSPKRDLTSMKDPEIICRLEPIEKITHPIEFQCFNNRIYVKVEDLLYEINFEGEVKIISKDNDNNHSHFVGINGNEQIAEISNQNISLIQLDFN